MVACNSCGGASFAPVFSARGFDLVQCLACDLAQIANPLGGTALAALYGDGGGDYHAELRDRASAASRRMARIAAAHLDFVGSVARAGRLLDLGCSTGLFLERAAAMGFAASGIEFSAASARFAAGRTGLPVMTGTIHDCDEPDASFDVITAFDVIEHVPDPGADLRRAWDLLKPGGWLVLSTPNIDGLFPRASRPLAGLLGYWPHPEPPYHLFQFSVATLTELLARCGFEPGHVRHRAIDLRYTFGQPAELLRMPKRLVYALAFAPLAALGPLLGMGDWFYIAARKPA
ncbi:MAG: class I SAM-dependent methyltransferase [Sphingomonadales bacterium]|nr:class I SAM-dependent methyltransferase [Sphingomonadales bacterium]